MTTPFPWSHSSISQAETCPRQYEEIKVLRHFQDQKNPASLWGDEVHRAFEKYIGGAVTRMDEMGYANRPLALDVLLGAEQPWQLPVNMIQYAPYLRQFCIREGRTLVEQQLAINRLLQPTTFFAEDVWGRGIIDVLTLLGREAWVDDHKTGKNQKKDMQQLIIFALLVFYHYPEIETVHTAFHWLQLGAVDTETFQRSEIPALWSGYPASGTRPAWEGLVPRLGRYAGFFHSGIFPPKKSGLCRKHCAVNTCEYFGGTK